jgi:fluoroacetyl-CoA thioesterase
MDLSALTPGLQGTAETLVDASTTALALGSGSEAVFATPALVALMEQAAVAAIAPQLPAGAITLGTRIAVDHLAATAEGGHVTATAVLTAVTARTLTFSVTARDPDKLVGEGTHIRAVVDRQRFLDKLAQPR